MTSSVLRRMGTCFSFCCWESRKRARQGNQAKYFDASSLIEFETLIDEPPVSGARSISSWLGMKTGKLAFQEETLELEGERPSYSKDLSSEGQEMSCSPVAPDPNWLSQQAQSWIRTNENGFAHMVRDGGEDENLTPILTRLPKRERLTSSPHSSVELEWENEVGLTPPQQCESVTEDDFVYVPGADTSSNHSTPLSNENDLEWDGDFSSVQISGFHVDTEQLISEIEQMTAEALREPTTTVRGKSENMELAWFEEAPPWSGR